MFNRELRLKVVKKAKNDSVPSDQSEGVFDSKVAVVNDVIDNTLKKIGLGLVVYVLVDTGRKVLVAKASKS